MKQFTISKHKHQTIMKNVSWSEEGTEGEIRLFNDAIIVLLIHAHTELGTRVILALNYLAGL